MTRKYEETHPWISFELDLRRVSYELWMLLGEAASKCEHVANVPLDPTTEKELHLLYLAKGAHATVAIEGNTLTEDEVADLLKGELVLPPNSQYQEREVKNIIDACNHIGNRVLKGEACDISLERILELHRLVMQGLPPEEDLVPGEVRTKSVGVTGARYRGAPPEDCEFLVTRLSNWLNELECPFPDQVVAWGLLKALLAHLYIAWIHPFANGNGRTARLVEFQVLLSSGVSTPVSHLLSNHYNRTRQEYYRVLDQTSKAGGDILPFISYAVRGFVDELRHQIKTVRFHQWDVAWENFVYETFKSRKRSTDRRRRTLVLSLSKQKHPVPINRLREIGSDVAESYAGRSAAIIKRDIDLLIEMDLLEKTDKGLRAKKQKILAFLPPRRVHQNP